MFFSKITVEYYSNNKNDRFRFMTDGGNNSEMTSFVLLLILSTLDCR